MSSEREDSGDGAARAWGEAISVYRDTIVARFTARLEQEHLAPEPKPRSVLIDHLDDLLLEIAHTLCGEPGHAPERTARNHAKQRWATGFDLGAVVREYGILWEILLHLAEEEGIEQTLHGYRELGGTLFRALVVAVEEYTSQREEQQRAQTNALEESRAILDALLMGAPLGVAFLDRDLRFRLLNQHLAELSGIAREEHLGKTPMDVLPELTASVVTDLARDVLESGEPRRDVELAAETPARPGVLRFFAEHWYPVKVGEQAIGVGAIVEDVTERKRAQSFRERILGVVSHDLRNPLNAIMVAGALLVERGAEGDAPRLGKRILASAARMHQLVDQLLDYVRVDETGRVPLDRRPIDLGALARRVLEEAELAIGRPDIATAIETRGDLTGSWDDGRLAQVLSNLIGNALQHGQRTIVVRVIGEHDAVRIEVENEAEPIPADVLANMFEPFRSGSEGRQHVGLGLFIARQIVVAHGGAIDVTSGAVHTRFTVTLPRSFPSP